jgi:hypothetical protein
MVLTHILGHQPLQMPLIEHDHVVQQVSSTTPNPTFRDRVLPRAVRTGSLPMSFAQEATSLPNFESWSNSGICARLRMARLPSSAALDPKSVGISCYVATENLAPIMADDEKAIQHAKRERRYGKGNPWQQWHRDDSAGRPASDGPDLAFSSFVEAIVTRLLRIDRSPT